MDVDAAINFREMSIVTLLNRRIVKAFTETSEKVRHTMRFMALVKGPQDEGAPPQALMDAMDKYVADQAQQGVFLDGGGLSTKAPGSARVRIKRGKLHVTDGPYAEAKEVVGGFAILNYATWEEALQGAREFMELHIKHWPEWEGECEIRQMEDVSG